MIATAKGEYDAHADGMARVGWGLEAENTITYQDDVICITKAVDTKALFIDKKDNQNPVLYITDDGEWLRQHGELCLLTRHIFNVARSCMDEMETELDEIKASWENRRKDLEKV